VIKKKKSTLNTDSENLFSKRFSAEKGAWHVNCFESHALVPWEFIIRNVNGKNALFHPPVNKPKMP
jgi:hypothetical protein